MEPKTIEHTAVGIAEAYGIKNRQSAKPLTVNICEMCKVRDATLLGGLFCMVCYRKTQIEKLTPEQQIRELLGVIPKRYIGADMNNLAEKLQTEFKKSIDTGLVLWGDPGIGKTYAMAALAKVYYYIGFTIERVHYEMLCLKLRDTFKPRATATELSVIEPLLTCDKLFIEDVGISKSIGTSESDFSRRTFSVLLDMRMEQCKPTFITSNKSVENLAASFDDRVGDRLKTFYVFNLGKESRRRSPQ